MHLKKQINLIMKKHELRRPDVVRKIGYKNVTKGLRRLDEWIVGVKLPQGQQHTLLAEFLELSKEELNDLLGQDQEKFSMDRSKKRALDPYYYLTTRLMAAVYQSRKLPIGTTQDEAIKITQSRAIECHRKCALNTPNNETLWFNEEGKLYHTSEQRPSMRIRGRELVLSI
jgi:hypothetical protein